MPSTRDAQPEVPSGLSRILDRCPGCAGEHLYTVFDGERVNFLCRSCSRCWTIGMGFVYETDPRTCPGCEWRPTCTSRFDRSPAQPEEHGPEAEGFRTSDPVLRLVSRSPVEVYADATLREIALVMEEDSIGSVLVRGTHGPVGIVSERDIVIALAAGADPDVERARDVMTPELAATTSAGTILAAAEMLLTNEIRHLAVTAGDKTVGVLSIRDVLSALVDAVGGKPG